MPSRPARKPAMPKVVDKQQPLHVKPVRVKPNPHHESFAYDFRSRNNLKRGTD